LGIEEGRAREAVEAIYQSHSRRVLATLIRLVGDFDLAEEALHDAFAAAVERWPRDGMRLEQFRLRHQTAGVLDEIA
jgi:RNA polymerase sigma-70 factor (ECF subfamily)